MLKCFLWLFPAVFQQLPNSSRLVKNFWGNLKVVLKNSQGGETDNYWSENEGNMGEGGGREGDIPTTLTRLGLSLSICFLYLFLKLSSWFSCCCSSSIIFILCCSSTSAISCLFLICRRSFISCWWVRLCFKSKQLCCEAFRLLNMKQETEITSDPNTGDSAASATDNSGLSNSEISSTM